MIRRPPRSTQAFTLFPTRRSSDLDASRQACRPRPAADGAARTAPGARPRLGSAEARDVQLAVGVLDERDDRPLEREVTELDAPAEQGPHAERESARLESQERR